PPIALRRHFREMIRQIGFDFVCSPFFGFELSSALSTYQEMHQFFIALSFQRFRNLRRCGRRWRGLGLSLNRITEEQACTDAEPNADEPRLAAYLRKFRGDHVVIISPIDAGENLVG